jgi:hypothetical protein
MTHLLGPMKFEENNANSTGIDHRWSQNIYIHIFLNTYTAELLKINDATTASDDVLEIIVKELSKISKDNRLKENWITTIKDLREVTTPDSWIKWNLLMKLVEELRSGIHSEKGIYLLSYLFSILSSIFILSKANFSSFPGCQISL